MPVNHSILSIRGPWKGKVTALPLEEQPPGTLYSSLDVLPRDCKTGKGRLSVRPGYAIAGGSITAAGFGLLGSAYNETGAVQLMAASSSTLYRWTGSAWSSVGSITSSTSRTVHMASYGKRMFVACNAPYRKYDYDSGNTGSPTHTMSDWTATAGTIPPNCRLCCQWGGRTVLAAATTVGATNDGPNIVFFSRDDNPLDWDFSLDDGGEAVFVPIGAAVTALIPHNKECLIAGTKSGMWIFRGNPAAANAAVEQFEFAQGPINSSAWCKGNDGLTYVLTYNGLYKMAAGCGSPLEQVSRDLIPDGLIGLDGTNSTGYLVYNERFRFVEIHVMGTNAASWFYDVDGGGFYEVTAPGTGILAAFYFGLLDSSTKSGALVATGNNGVRRLDSGTALGSVAYAKILFNLAPVGQKALIQRGVALWGSNSDDGGATTVIYAAENATNAIAQTADRKSASVTITQLQANHGTWFPRVGGHSALVKITTVDTGSYWSLEALTLYTIPNGTERG